MHEPTDVETGTRMVQDQEAIPSTKTHRRAFLQSTGALVGIGGFDLADMQVVDASNSKFQVGQVLFVEVALEHPDAPDYPRSSGLGLAQYIMDSPRQRLTLTSAPLAAFESDEGVAALNREFTELPTNTPTDVSNPYLFAESRFRQLGLEYLELEEEYQRPEIRVERRKDDEVALSAGGRTRTIPPRNTTTLELDPRTVYVLTPSQETKTVPNPRKDGPERIEVPTKGEVETVDVTPIVTVRNNGVVDVYGSSAFRVLPLDSEDPYAQARVHAALSNRPGDVLKEVENGLLAIPKGVS